jgi:hypothetical protein
VEQVGGLEVPPIVLYIDKQRWGRDCVSEQLASQLSGWSIEPLASMSELKKQADWSDESVVVLHAHSASVAAAELASEIAMVAEARRSFRHRLTWRTPKRFGYWVVAPRPRQQPPALSQVIGNPICKGEHTSRHGT